MLKQKNIKKIMNIKNKESGITLISLIVTVVTLIILSAISINYILKDNGMLDSTDKISNLESEQLEGSENELKGLEQEYADTINFNSQATSGEKSAMENLKDNITFNISWNGETGKANVTVNSSASSYTMMYKINNSSEKETITSGQTINGLNRGDIIYVQVTNGSYYTEYKKFEVEDDIVKNSGRMGYVTNGLILHYDGFNNTGDGHSSTTSTWKNLTGWKDPDENEYNGYLQTGTTWNGDSLNFNNGWVSIGEINPENLTIEVVVKNTTVKNSEVIYVGNYQGGRIWSCLW